MTKYEIKKSIETMIRIKAEGARGVWCSESDNAYDSSTYLATEEIEVILQALQEQLDRMENKQVTCKKCKWHVDSDGTHRCIRLHIYPDFSDFYCAFGEPIEEIRGE